jgi:hypothetical protein
MAPNIQSCMMPRRLTQRTMFHGMVGKWPHHSSTCFKLQPAYAPPRKSMVAVDSQKRICMAFVGHPGDAAYLKSCNAVYDLMQQAKSKSNLARHTKRHTRGCFTVLNAGLVHGKGTSYPMNKNNKEYNNLVAELLTNSHLQRIASFASSKTPPMDATAAV